MAITFASAGTGASTETSGAALTPALPGSYINGDILIAHVFWEGTTTAPSDPGGGWTLLSGPHVIETTIARHWVYGRIADGTETAPAFGSPAVTTQRGARVYAFTGRVAGTISQLVTGFAHLSHATDPQMPTVTTTIAGAMAVALVAQNDNNTFADATGETGGDWGEEVAEYTVALTPGFSLGIQKTTPTADPGTVTGGTIATTNDPCGVIGFQIMPSAGTSVTTAVGTVTIAGLAPTVSVTNNLNIVTAVGTVTIAGLAPTVSVSDNKNVTPGIGTVVIAGLAPTFNQGTVLYPGVGTIVIDGLAPTVNVSDNKNINTDTGAVVIAGLEPTISVTDNKNIITDTGTVVIAGLSPTVTVSDHKNITAGLGEIVISGLAPTVTVSDNKNITTGLGVVVIEGLSPTVSVSNHISVTPGTGTIVISGLEPSVGGGVVLSTSTGVVTIEGLAPTINVSVSADTQTGQVVIVGLSPTISVTDNQNIFTGTGEVVIAGLSPTIDIGGGAALVDTGTGLVVIAGLSPTVTVSSGGGGSQTINVRSRITRTYVLRRNSYSDGNRQSRVGYINLKSKVRDGI